ncbi:helix-turn-helix domain-containing protein [Polaromonas sp. P1(28)-8]|nr:helix-turn-helix domain-containing protein [Polaromonas sp. P1(28)-8]
MKARDARFDGSFFTGVTSTGIYCRPVCSVKTPKRENCRFFSHAAQAESAGFRPCLRCRPELAPHSVVWSIQDASYILAHQAARLLDEPEDIAPTLVASRAFGGALPLSRGNGAELAQGGPALRPSGLALQEPTVAKLAARLGVSDRHVRRIFEAQFGVSPMQYLQTRRLHTAKQLLADTSLPITQVALISGYASVRRFNAAFVEHYKLNPTQLRRQGVSDAGQANGAAPGITIRLGYRPPYDVAAMLGFFSKRTISAIEFVAADAQHPSIGRTFRVESGGKVHAGWLLAAFDEARSRLVLNVSDSLREVLPLVIRRVRATFDLDADPAAINSVLHTGFPQGDGLRVPGALDGYELAVRAVLGQQITVAAGAHAGAAHGRPVWRAGANPLAAADPAVPGACRAGRRERRCVGAARHCQAAPGRDCGHRASGGRQTPAAAQRRRCACHAGGAEGLARHRRLDRAVHRYARPALARCVSGGRCGAAQGDGRAGTEKSGPGSRAGLECVEALAQLCRDPRMERHAGAARLTRLIGLRRFMRLGNEYALSISLDGKAPSGDHGRRMIEPAFF